MAESGHISSKRVLITGAAGFIGQKLASKLHYAGAEVHGTSRGNRTHHELPICWWKASFDNLSDAERILKAVKPDIIFHLAGMVTGANGAKNVIPTYHSLATSTVNLLSLATEMGCQRIVIIGSSNEPTGNDPNSPYAAAKWASSVYARMFYNLYKLPIVIARCFVAYGPGQPKEKLIPYVLSQLCQGEQPQLTSGAWRTDWIYIDDLIDGLLCCATVPGIEGSTIDIGTGQLTSVRHVVEKLVTLLDSTITPSFGAIADRYDEHTPVADVETTCRKIGWNKKVLIDEGLRRTVDAFRVQYAEPKEVKFLKSDF